jgi:hypothetical protein
MSTNNAETDPPSTGDKEGTPRTLLSSMTSEDIFKAMNLMASAYFETCIPGKERGGNVGLGTGHIRGYSSISVRVIRR